MEPPVGSRQFGVVLTLLQLHPGAAQAAQADVHASWVGEQFMLVSTVDKAAPSATEHAHLDVTSERAPSSQQQCHLSASFCVPVDVQLQQHVVQARVYVQD